MKYLKRNLHLLPVFYLLILIASNLLMYIIKLNVEFFGNKKQIVCFGYWYHYSWDSSRLTLPTAIVGGCIGILFFLLIWWQKKFTLRQRSAWGAIYLLCAFFSLFFMPPTGINREPIRKIACMYQLLKIHTMLQNYAKDYNGQYPPDLATLSKSGYLSEDILVFRCPSQIDHLPGFSDYLYFGAAKNQNETPFIILSDSDYNHAARYQNQIYSNGNLINITYGNNISTQQ